MAIFILLMFIGLIGSCFFIHPALGFLAAVMTIVPWYFMVMIPQQIINEKRAQAAKVRTS